MLAKATNSPKRDIFICRIYRFLLAVVFVFAYWEQLYPQEIGAYKTIKAGDFSDLSTWNIFDGASWQSATTKPTQLNDIYIDRNHTLRLVGNESAKSVFINAEAGAAQKLNLNGNNLDIYGSLQGFDGTAPGTPNRAWNSINWIGNSIASTITFKGDSRTIINLNTWTGQSDRSRYSVIFDPGPSVELIVEEAFKALSFTIKSGSVYQKTDNSSVPSKCPTFSFNTETTVFGAGAFGNFTIEPGAKLISDCDSDILFRSSTQSASLLNLFEGAELILEGTSPQIEAATFQLDGKVIFRNNLNPQNFLASSFPGTAIPNTFNDLEIEGSQNVSVPSYLNLSGDLLQTGAGIFLMNSSEIEFSGNKNQIVDGFSMTVGDLTINKASGIVSFSEDLTVLNDLEMISGEMDLQENHLSINASFTGGLVFSGGSWKNVNQFTYFGAPTTFDAINGTFPFADKYHGGIRKVQFLGTSAGGNLQITFTEYKGADYSASFSDSDGTPILYRLFSYFQFSGLNPSSNPLEFRISADQLIVDQVDDLRIVATGYAAPGSHLSGLDPGLWARRNLTFDDLNGVNFTVGSYRTLTILPLLWLKTSAKWEAGLPKIEWEITGDSEQSYLEIYRFTSFNPTKERLKKIENYNINTNAFIDSLPIPLGEIYYQLKYTNSYGEENWSPVFRLIPMEVEKAKLFPNPGKNSENIYLVLPSTELNRIIQIVGMDGNIITEGNYDGIDISQFIKPLPLGIYLIRVYGNTKLYSFKFIKN